MFSRRTPDDLEPNELSRLLERARDAGEPPLDLVDSNPTRAGIEYPRAEIDAALAAAGAGVYEPEPRGLLEAREAVAAHLAGRGARVSAEHILLCASTSEAYGFLFKLLCDPGDEVLFPAPSYPLFEHLARVEGVNARSYRLDERRGYSIDLERIETEIGPRTRALVLVNPNNPTGTVTERDLLQPLAELAERRGLALIGDEVFSGYRYDNSAPPVPCTVGAGGGLRFSLGGLSKEAGLPQLKLSWIAAGGPPELLRPALERLDYIADTFLSVGGPVQRALPRLLEIGGEIRRRIRERVIESRAVVRDQIAGAPGATLSPAGAGWYGVLEVANGGDEETVCLELLEADRVLVHPGYFFDFDDEASRLVLCLLAPPERVLEAMSALRRRLAAQ